MSTPPVLAAGALYDNLLQAALRQFFERASLDAQAAASVSSDGRLAIEPTPDPAVLIIRWFGTRYRLRVPGRWPFTSHEVRLARAIGSVLAARYRAILNPRTMFERGDLFRGAIEDRYVGAYLDPQPYTSAAREARADRIASIIELLRVAALSSYENRHISTGLLLLGGGEDPRRPGQATSVQAPAYAESLSGIKSFFRLADGMRTLFLANADGRLLDIIDVERWADATGPRRALDTPCARAFQAHALATARGGHVCVVLSPSREIKVFADGAQVFAFRGAAWHLLDVQEKCQRWCEAVGETPLAMKLFQTALDLADARDGALFVVLRDAEDASQLVAPADRLDLPAAASPGTPGPTRRDLLHLLEGRSATDLDPSVLAALASLDGALVVDRGGRLRAAGAILRHPMQEERGFDRAVEGARTTAAIAASRFGPVLKVSEDGVITFFDGERVWDL